MFQSLVGFKINWNLANPTPIPPAVEEFQSLVGFKINWNKFPINSSKASSEFQSLVGFKINWNRKSQDILNEILSFNP